MGFTAAAAARGARKTHRAGKIVFFKATIMIIIFIIRIITFMTIMIMMMMTRQDNYNGSIVGFSNTDQQNLIEPKSILKHREGNYELSR